MNMKCFQVFAGVFIACAFALTSTGYVHAAKATPPIPRIESEKEPEVERDAPLEGGTVRSQSLQSLSITAEVSAEPQLGPNLIANPSFEASNTSTPGWNKGGYGNNTRVFTFPVSGHNGGKAARVAVSNYVSGDAKWYFNDVAVTPGQTYQFSDHYLSNVSSTVTVRYKMSDGSFRYSDIGSAGPSSSFQKFTSEFVIPPGVVSLTIFHLIKQSGNLITDEYSLNAVTQAPEPPSGSNLISNGNFETAGTSGNPAQWNRGRWGSNTAVWNYPVTGANGSRAAQVTLTNYSSGDAKWYFTPIALSPGTYLYSDVYRSNVTTYVTVQLQANDGTYSYRDIATAGPSSVFAPISGEFTVPAGTRAVTVFHLLKGNGTLTIDNATLKVKTGRESIFETGAVSLVFDDALLSQYRIAVPKLNAAGMKGSFFAATRQLRDYGFTGYMSKSEIEELHRQGHEIGAHTRTHAHLTTLSEERQRDEIEGSRQDLLAMDAGPVEMFVYPFGEYDETTLQIVKDAGFTGARASINTHATEDSPRFELPRRSVESHVTVSQVKQWIDNALLNKQWVILVFHGIDNSGNRYTTSPETLQQIIDYIKSKNARVVTMGEGVDYVAP